MDALGMRNHLERCKRTDVAARRDELHEGEGLHGVEGGRIGVDNAEPHSVLTERCPPSTASPGAGSER